MPCVHLTQLIQLCEQSQVRLSSSDLIHIVCTQCDKHEVCPSELLVEDGREVTEEKSATEAKGEASSS